MKVHLLLLLSLLALTACDRVEPQMKITQTREISPLAGKPNIDIAASTRFYHDQPKKEHPLVWKTPEGWNPAEASQMRLINFTFGPESEGECYLTALQGDGGGAEANLNRWRGQVGQPPLTAAEISALPKRKLMGSEGYFLSVDGEFKGMGDAKDAKKDYRLVGLLLPNPELTMFVKMTGPRALLEQQMAAFDTFCQSLQFRAKSEAVPSH
jgi:hypothetical protein